MSGTDLSEDDDGGGGEDDGCGPAADEAVEEDGERLVDDHVRQEEGHENPVASAVEELVDFGCVALGGWLSG